MNSDQTVVSVIGSVVVAFVTGLLTYLTTRSKNKTDVQASLNAGFNTLVSELQEERAELARDRAELRRMVHDQDKEILSLQRRIDRLLTVTTAFHNFIVSSGLIPPPFEADDILGSNDND